MAHSAEEAAWWAERMGMSRDYLEGVGAYYYVDEPGRERGITQAVYRYPTRWHASRRVRALAEGALSLDAGSGQVTPPQPLSLHGFEGYVVRVDYSPAAVQVFVGSRGAIVMLLQVPTFVAGEETFDDILPLVLEHVDVQMGGHTAT